ncbi:hypothetical protein SAMN04487898_106116 [Pedobacter sp. ok626]|uniref:hypothetical protein n=1 Tax=Pedobacter sp. ok626 TaxID=1761882 RepID=UPI0008858600|nr:hypothetical protein [Pedobacter sp. ok626]SDK12772.1 hypothetical protein SAMN04487898_106116 [Pedobacter sp. ok626]
MKRIIFIGLLFCIIISGCKGLNFENDCYLDFKLGMNDYDYNHLVREYVKRGILKEQFTKTHFDDADRKNFLTEIADTHLQGTLEPIFLSDRLDELRIFIGEDISYDSKEATSEMYNKIVNYFTNEKGKPREQSKDNKTGHKLTVWETNQNYNIEVLFVPEWELSKKKIAIYFSPTGVLEKDLDDYNKKKEITRQ